ncbi:MAG TPA: ice-binding family protein, partial [Kofleriaceae bacterium]|nr:ice-binding family protein [Kofleriaceae bacterium]
GDASGDGEGDADPDDSDAMAIDPIVHLGTAGNFAILAKSGITNASTSSITGDLGVSPIASGSVTGFALMLDRSGTFATSTQVDGRFFASDYAAPTPTRVATAVLDMSAAFAEAGGRPVDVIDLGGGDIGDMTLVPGVYSWPADVVIAGDVVLDGSAADSWVLEIGEDLIMNNGTSILLTGGAVAENVFWRVSGLVDLRAGAHCEGAVMAATAVNLAASASVNGRLLAQTAVTLSGNTVVEPAR